MVKRTYQKIERTPEQQEELRQAREHYQATKPSLAELVAAGETVVPLGIYITLRCLAVELRKEREKQGLTLTEVASRAGMDAAALSRLETGKSDNPTVETVCRIAQALGKTVHCTLQDAG